MYDSMIQYFLENITKL